MKKLIICVAIFMSCSKSKDNGCQTWSYLIKDCASTVEVVAEEEFCNEYLRKYKPEVGKTIDVYWEEIGCSQHITFLEKK